MTMYQQYAQTKQTILSRREKEVMAKFLDIINREYKNNWNMLRLNDDVEVFIENVKDALTKQG